MNEPFIMQVLENRNIGLPKPDKVFDLYESATTARAPINFDYARNVSYWIISDLVNKFFSYKQTQHGRYFYYTKDTARYARSGLAGNNAYLYSLGDPNAEIRPLTHDEISRLNTIDRIAYKYHSFFFFSGVFIALAFAAYIGYQYSVYENLWPTLLIIPIMLIGVPWYFAINTSEGGSLKMLPKDVIAYGNEPNLPVSKS